MKEIFEIAPLTRKKERTEQKGMYIYLSDRTLSTLRWKRKESEISRIKTSAGERV